MKITNKITVHMDDRHIVPWVDAVQCDANTRVLELTLLEGGEAWAVPSGMVVSVAFRKSDGTAGWYDRLPDGSGACAYSGNVVTAVLAPQVLTAWGKTEVAVVIQDPDTLDQIAVFPIRVEVARNPAAGKGISNDHYDYKTLAEVNEVLAGIDRCIRPYAWTVKTADLAQSGWATFLDLPTDHFYRCSSDLAASFGLPVVGAPCTLVVFDPSNEKTGAYWHRMYICTVRRDMGEETYLAYVAPETAAADVVWRKVATGDVNDKVDNLGTYLCFYPVVLNIDTAADTITLNPGYLYTRGGQKIRIAEKVTVPRAVDGMSMLVYDTRDAAVKSIDAAKLESSHVVIAILSGLEHVGHPNANFVPGRWSVDWVVVPDGKRTDSVLCVGDSIARGDSNGKKGFVGELGLPYRNAAVSGATISNVRTDRQNVADQLLAVEGYHPGIVIAQGGINDYFRNAPLGTVPTAKAASAEGLDRGTVLGALEYLFCQMEQRYPQAERYFLLGHRTANGGKDLSVTANAAGYTMTQMYDAFREVCRLYGVGVIDVFGKSPIDTADPMYVSPVAHAQDASVGERYFVDADGIHPLAFGYRHGYVPIVRAALGIGEDAPVDLNVVIDTIRAYVQHNGLSGGGAEAELADGVVTIAKLADTVFATDVRDHVRSGGGFPMFVFPLDGRSNTTVSIKAEIELLDSDGAVGFELRSSESDSDTAYGTLHGSGTKRLDSETRTCVLTQTIDVTDKPYLTVMVANENKVCDFAIRSTVVCDGTVLDWTSAVSKWGDATVEKDKVFEMQERGVLATLDTAKRLAEGSLAEAKAYTDGSLAGYVYEIPDRSVTIGKLSDAAFELDRYSVVTVSNDDFAFLSFDISGIADRNGKTAEVQFFLTPLDENFIKMINARAGTGDTTSQYTGVAFIPGGATLVDEANKIYKVSGTYTIANDTHRFLNVYPQFSATAETQVKFFGVTVRVDGKRLEWVEAHRFNGGTVFPIVGVYQEGDRLLKLEHAEQLIAEAIGSVEASVNDTKDEVAQLKALIGDGMDTVVESPLNGKKWGVVGDSITFGTGTTDSSTTYHKYISEKYLMSISQKGIPGWCIALRPTYNDTLIDSVGGLPADCDYVTVFAGTNDYGNSIPIGTFQDTTNETFYGAVKLMCEALYARFGGKKFAFFTPTQRSDGDRANSASKTLKDYRDVIMEVCAYYGIPVLDLYAESGIRPALYAGFTGDGLHLNDAGHERISNMIAKFLERL